MFILGGGHSSPPHPYLELHRWPLYCLISWTARAHWIPWLICLVLPALQGTIMKCQGGEYHCPLAPPTAAPSLALPNASAGCSWYCRPNLLLMGYHQELRILQNARPDRVLIEADLSLEELILGSDKNLKLIPGPFGNNCLCLPEQPLAKSGFEKHWKASCAAAGFLSECVNWAIPRWCLWSLSLLSTFPFSPHQLSYSPKCQLLFFDCQQHLVSTILVPTTVGPEP